MKTGILYLLSAALLITASHTMAQNPFITGQFTADPSARVFNGKVYVYPSHDIPCTEGRGRIGWFCMEDYHVFSSPDLTTWTDHGVIVSQNNVKWVDPNSYSMWAPDCIFKNGKYYFYFPSRPKDTVSIKGFTIGVAIADKPEGPFVTQDKPIGNVRGIDPNVFIDKDGQAYLFWSQGHIYAAKLTDNMLDLATEPKILMTLPEKGLKEGPYMFERNGIYYLTYPHVENKTERLEYATGDNPLGPFSFKGVIMDESSTGCWTNHHSVIEFKKQWYLFYHHNDLSPQFDKNRSIRIDSLFFYPDGTIKKVIPTLRGVGITPATKEIQIDRYSDRSPEGVSISFLDTLNKFAGWKTVMNGSTARIQYNNVDFGRKKLQSIKARTLSATGGTLHIKIDKPDGPEIAKIIIPIAKEWKTVSSPLLTFPAGLHDLHIEMEGNGTIEIDWVSFE